MLDSPPVMANPAAETTAAEYIFALGLLQPKSNPLFFSLRTMGAAMSIEQSAVLSGGLILALAFILSLATGGSKDTIPLVGVGSGLFAAQVASVRSVTSLQNWISEGYRQYKAGVFRVRSFRDWLIVISGPELIDELRRAPEHVLSFREAVGDSMQGDYTMGDWREETSLHITLLKGRLTRSLPQLFPSAVDEINAAFMDEVTSKLSGSDWATMPIAESIMRVVCRTSNRIFVGLPLCRNPEYVDLNVRYTIDVAISASVIKQFPAFLKPLVGRFLTPIPRTYKRAERVMIGFIEERKRQTAENGKDWEDKPDDFLQWLIDTGEPRETETRALMTRLLRLNFAAIHTTALSFTFALYRIAAEPEKYQEPIRQEVHEVLSRHGWTKAAMERLRRVDSLLREAQRFHGLGAVAMIRKAMQDFTFADGTAVKKGQSISVAARPTHWDAAIYPQPEEFDGFRFFNEDENESDSLPNRLVSTSLEFLRFGTGRHACPGRFWAANEMKAMMAYMVTHYDMKLEHEGVIPKETWLGVTTMPDRNTRLVIRKREAPVY